MKTVEQLQNCVKKCEERLVILNKEAMDLLGVRPYTDAVARQEKAKYREIEKEQDRIAELRQSIVYIQTTPPEKSRNSGMPAFASCKPSIAR